MSYKNHIHTFRIVVKWDLICLFSFILTKDPSVLNDWLEVVRPGGIICFTHKSSVLGGWEAEQEKISNANKWSTLFIHPGIPYLPSLQLGEAKNCKEIVRIYIYRKNNQKE